MKNASIPDFLAAVSAGDAAQVAAWLEGEPALANARNERGDSALLLAAYGRRQDIVALRLRKGAQRNIFEAAAVGDKERVAWWLQTEPHLLNSYSHDGWTPLHLAAFFGHQEAAQLLLSRGASLEARSKSNFASANTPLHAAAANGSTEVVGLLLAAGADVNAVDGAGYTPLHIAAHAGNTTLVELLLSRGADVGAKKGDETPLALAAKQGHDATAALLRQRGVPS